MTLALARADVGTFAPVHGHAGDGRGKRSPTYNSWRCMLDRCRREKHPYFHRYGGRGIEVCARWQHGEGGKTGFACFLEDMGERPSLYHTLERERVNEGYGPDNCCWATKREQANNRSSNHLVNWNGQTMSLSEAVDSAGQRRNYPVIIKRLGRGWDLRDAITTPVDSSERLNRRKRKQVTS